MTQSLERLNTLQDVYNCLWNLSKTSGIKHNCDKYKGVCLSIAEVRGLIEEERRRLSVYGQQK